MQRFSWFLGLVGIFVSGVAFGQCCSCDLADGCPLGQEETGNSYYPCDVVITAVNLT